MIGNTVRISDSQFADPAINQDYFNAKYKAWLKRRGFTDELEKMAIDRANQFRKKTKKTS